MPVCIMPDWVCIIIMRGSTAGDHRCPYEVRNTAQMSGVVVGANCVRLRIAAF